jgi:hypothetical protein
MINRVAVELARTHKDDPEFCLISIHDCLVSTSDHESEITECIQRRSRKFWDSTFLETSRSIGQLGGEIVSGNNEKNF